MSEADQVRNRRGSGFAAVAFAFLIVMAVATLPSPLYGLYRSRDHLSALMITVVFAIFAGGTIATPQRDNVIAGRIGRRGMMLAAVATMMVAMGVLAAWKDLPGLLTGRVLSGAAVGLAAGTAITYLTELRLRADPKASAVRARTIATAVNIGALGVGTICMLAGLVLLVVSVRPPAPSLALFLVGGALIGAGSGTVFNGTTGIVLEASPPESRVAMTSDLLIALFAGLSVPVIGAGVALDLGASPPSTVLSFAILVGLGVAVSGWALRPRRRAQETPQPSLGK
jgi:MFS family permease